MEIILKNLPETNEEVYLIIESTLSNENIQILNNNNNETNNEKRNEVVISQNKYKFSNIDTKIENNLFSNVITNQLIKKNDLTLLLAINKNQSESENNLNNFFVKEINNTINKEFFEKNKIKQIIYNYYKINLEKNNIDNIIKEKSINKDSENEIILDKKNIKEENCDLSFLQIQFDYFDDIINIPIFIKVFFIYNSFEKILPLFTIDKKEKQILVLKEKIDNLLLLEKDIKEKISNLPLMNNDFIHDLNIYKNEVTNYYENLVKNVNMDKNENKIKIHYNNKNNLNELIKEAKILLDNINKEQFKNREKDIYQKYIQVYSNINKDNKFDINELKISINNFNNLNEELLEFLEKEKRQKESKDKDKEISQLKQKIKQLEKELKSEKNKSQQTNNNNNNNNTNNENIQSKNSKAKQRSVSALKISNSNNNNNNKNSNNSPYINRLEDENKKLKRNIEELKETISQLKSKNDSLFKTNEKLLKEKNSSSNYNHSKNNNKDNKDNKSILNSPKKNTTQSNESSNIKEKKNKILNKTKTNADLLFNGNSLLLLKKIQEENKELSKQLKDFSSKNVQLELSLKGINGTEMKQKNKNNNSLLFNFTKNTRGELKNIEKKYGLAKNK